MKAPKINKGYKDGGPTKNVNPGSKMTPKEWDEFAASKGWKVIPTNSASVLGRHNQYYDPSAYSATPNEIGSGEGSSLSFTKIGNDPYNKPIMQYYFQEPVKQVNPLPVIDSNRKPLNFNSPSQVYNPNTNTYSTPGTGYGAEIPKQTLAYKKGGIVSKIKGYYDGGDVYDPNKPISGQGIIQQPGQVQITPTGNAQNAQGFYTAQQGFNQNVPVNNMQPQNQSNERTDKQIKNEANARGLANTAGSALGAYGASYFATQTPTNEGDAARNAGLGAVSGMGGIGGAIGGIAAIGDKIGKPIKQSSEQLDAQGNLKNEGRARKNAIGGGLFSPSKALVARGSYKGGYTDITGKGYTAHLEEEAKKQLATAEAENALAKQKSAVEARNEGQVGFKPKDMYDMSSAKFDENGQLILQPARYKKGGVVGKVMQKCADGGVIKGKGTGKSDSISAKVKEGSFIVPAENAAMAEELRKKVLGKSPKTKANLNEKGGAQVKLSNGEHKFSPEEKQELINKDIDVNKLAPNAEQKEYIKVPKIVGFKDGGPIDWNKYYSDKSRKTGKTYKEIITPPREFKGSAEDWKRVAEKAIKEGKIVPSDYVAKKTTKVTSAPIATNKKANAYTPSKAEYTPESDIIVPVAKTTTGDKQAAVDAKALSDSAYAADTANNPALKTPPKKGLLSRLSNLNIDPTMFVGPMQTALGAKMLGETKRPDYKPELDPELNRATEEALNAAKYGLSGQEKLLAEQNLQNEINDARYAARNLSGGNAGQAFNQERQVLNSGLANRLNMQIADQQLRREKQQYANSLAANRAAINAQNKQDVFNVANQAFNQRQQSGAELVGAGLANTVGAYRYNRNQKMMDEANQAGNPWMNYNYNPNV